MKSMTEKKIAIINRTQGIGDGAARESLDLIFAISALNESISIFFINDAVYQISKHHRCDQILQKQFQPLFQLLKLYEITDIYVCKESLRLRGLEVNPAIISGSLLDKKALQLKLAEQDQLLSF